jgi:glycosyltransferase involved in cell wall biosynthesis
LDVSALRKKWDIDPESLVVLSPRSLKKPLYCIDSVLRAFQGVLEKYPEALLLQLGSNEYPEVLERLKRLAASLGIASRVRWLEFIDEEELPQVFGLAELTLSLSTSDSLPTSLLEAMASGSIPIFSDVGSISEWIVPGENGVLVPPGDSEALTDAILKTLARPAEWWADARAKSLAIIQARADRSLEFSNVNKDYARLVDGRTGKNASSAVHLEGRGEMT